MIVAAVQARMNSTRLPGKALAEIAGRPLLWHIVNRLSFAHRLDRVVIATSAEPPDAPIRAFARRHGIPCFAGSELDLIDRLYGAARRFDADVLVRVTGDCPLTDPRVIDEMVRVYLSFRERIDCVVTNTVPPTFPDGLDAEVYSLRTLERLWKEITDPFWREWFPLFLIDHPEALPRRNMAHAVDLSALRWTVDYEEDLTFVREVYRRLYREGEVFGMEEVLALLREEPGVSEINARYTRNEGYAVALAATGRTLGDGGCG